MDLGIAGGCRVCRRKQPAFWSRFRIRFRASRAGTRRSASIWDPTAPHPPSGPWGSRADRIALAVADLDQQGPARTNPTCRRWVECVQSRRLLGLVVAPRATRRNFVRFGDPPFSRALAASPPRSGWLPGTAVTSGLFRPSRVSSAGFHCHPDRGRPSYGLEGSPPRLGRESGRTGE